METREQIIERLFKADLITFQEAMILNMVGFPKINILDSLNDIYQIPGPGTVTNEDKPI